MNMNRRELLRSMAVLAAGASVLPAMAHIHNAPADIKFLAAMPSYVKRSEINFFSERQRAIATICAELIIPRTDTPGAIDANVPKFVELMVAQWMTDAEREILIKGINDLDARTNGRFVEMPAAEQQALLETLEEESADANWYGIGSVFRVWDSEAPFICQFKELVVIGFMFSEEASYKFLRLNPMGEFKGDVALKETDPAYVAEPLRWLFQG